jgi:hypothetical protein
VFFVDLRVLRGSSWIFVFFVDLRVLYCRYFMSEESTRNWTITYISVIAVEILVLLGLLWLQSRFTI